MTSTKPNNQPSYTFKGVENAVNNIIKFIFYYRLVLVMVCLLVLGFIEYNIWHTPSINRSRNFAIVLTGGSIIIGIFYSILNYEYNHIRFRYDTKSSIDVLTFTTACKTYDTEMIGHFKALKNFHIQNKQLITNQKMDEFHQIIEADIATKTSFIATFNYFECISLGIEQGIMDEEFMKAFFRSMFLSFLGHYEGYIKFLRVENNTPKIYINFCNMCARWQSEN